MAFVPATNVAEIRINQRLHGEQIQNNLFAFGANGWPPLQLELLAGEIITWVGTQLYPLLSDQISLFSVAVRDLTVQDGLQFEVSPTVPVTGDRLGSALPGNVAACVSFRTGFTGRSRRGRNYIAGLTESDVSGNLLDVAEADGLRAAYETLIQPNGPIGSAGGRWCVLSRIVLGLPRLQGLVTPITSVIVDNRVDSQRRRLAGRGS